MDHPEDVQPAWLSSFLAVVTQGTFTAAARVVHRTQPRVSAHIAALEDALDVTLLDRGHRGVTLTEAGARFLPHARAALSDIRAGMDSVRSLSGQLQGKVVVGSFPGASGVLLAPLIKTFREQHPGVSVELHEGDPGWLEDAVANVDVDLAVRSADIPQRHAVVVSRHLLHERIMVVAPRGHEVLADPPVDPAVLDGRQLVVTGAPAEGWTDFTERMSALGISPARIEPVSHPTTVIALARARLGIGMLGEMAARITAFGDVATSPLPTPDWQRDIRAYWNNKRQLSMAAAAFLDALVEARTEPAQSP